MLDSYIEQLVGENAKHVLVITDSEVDINTSGIAAENISLATFDKFKCVHSETKDTKFAIENIKNGVYIKLTETLTDPLHIVFEENDEKGNYIFLDVAPNVEATIIEHQTYCQCDCYPTGAMIPIAIEGVIGANSHISYNAFNMSEMNLQMQRYFNVKRDANVQYAAGMFGDNCTSETYFNILEEGAEVDSKTMMFVKDGCEQKHRIQINHLVGHTKSYMQNHGVVDGTGSGEFENIGFIERWASQADAQQESRIMTLDDAARAYVHPILLIDEYDVIAGHAGSVGRASEEALYYLQSRGLTRKAAQLLITEGFLRPVVEGISDTFTKERIEGVIS